jgi:hypothetical protein
MSRRSRTSSSSAPRVPGMWFALAAASVMAALRAVLSCERCPAPVVMAVNAKIRRPARDQDSPRVVISRIAIKENWTFHQFSPTTDAGLAPTVARHRAKTSARSAAR